MRASMLRNVCVYRERSWGRENAKRLVGARTGSDRAAPRPPRRPSRADGARARGRAFRSLDLEAAIPHVRKTPCSSLTLASAVVVLISVALTRGAPPAHAVHTPAQQLAHRSTDGDVAAVPKSGIYDACSMGAPEGQLLPDCGLRLSAISQGGFDLVLNYSTGSMSIADNLAYAALARSRNLQLVWNLSDYRQPLPAKLDLVRATASHPATWGYYIGDEVRPDDRGQVKQLSSAIRAITPKPTLLVSRPKPYLLRPFAKLVDYLGPDTYPVGGSDPPVCETSRWGTAAARNPVIVLQSFSWSIDYPGMPTQWPSARRMRRMREAALRCGRPKLIFWFCFHCVTDYHPNPALYWPNLVWAANGTKPAATAISSGG